jgi:nitroreductase
MKHNSPSSETINLLNERVSVRQFDTRPVGKPLLDGILSAAFRAPTSSNIQAYSVIVVNDPQTRKRIAEIAGGQQHIIDAPVFLAFCADLTRLEQAMKIHRHDMGETNLEMGLVSSIDAALVGMSAYLAAESVGLKGVMIGAVRNDANATALALGLPKRVFCVFGMCLGWPKSVPPQKPRMDYSAMVHYERYGGFSDDRSTEQRLNDYDTALAAHYTATNKPTHPNSWSYEIDKKFVDQPRARLREQLRDLGFDFN